MEGFVPLSALAAAAAAWLALDGRVSAVRHRGRVWQHLGRAGSSPAVLAVFDAAPPLASLAAALAEGEAGLPPVPGPAAARGALVAVGPAAGVALAVLGADPVLVPVGCAAAWFALFPWSASVARRRARAVARAVPDAYRSLSGCLAAGQTMTQAVAYVGRHGRGAVARAFARGSFELACGSSVERAVGEVAAGIDDPSAGLLACALAISQRTGAPLASLLERAAELVEGREGLEQLLATKTAQVRMSAAVVMALPVVLVCLLALISPDFRAGMQSPVGVGCLVFAAALDGCAVALMAKIVSGVGL